MIVVAWVLLSLGFAYWATEAESGMLERLRKWSSRRWKRVGHALTCFECSVGWGSLLASAVLVPACLAGGVEPLDPQMLVLYAWPVSGIGLAYGLFVLSPRAAMQKRADGDDDGRAAG